MDGERFKHGIIAHNRWFVTPFPGVVHVGTRPESCLPIRAEESNSFQQVLICNQAEKTGLWWICFKQDLSDRSEFSLRFFASKMELRERQVPFAAFPITG